MALLVIKALFRIAAEKVPTMKSLDGVNKKNDVNDTASEAPEKNVKTESEKIDFSNVKIECKCRISWHWQLFLCVRV